jgi:hypothetical protein
MAANASASSHDVEDAAFDDADILQTRNGMMMFEFSLTYFLIQVAGGFVGAHAAALIAHEHRFGFVGHSLVGLAMGAFSGFCLQTIVMTTVTGTGEAIPITMLQAEIFQAVSGLVSGAIAMLAIGYIRGEIAKGTGE